MSTIYSNDDYAHQRLRNCVVMRNNKPFYIESVLRDGRVYGTPLTGTPHQDCQFNEVVFSFEEGFTLQTVPMGFMNTRADTRYLSRVPQRRWRQGLVADSIQGGMMNVKAFFSQSFCDMVNGDYPSFASCVSKVASGNVQGRAFSRKFAVFYERGSNTSFRLMYKRTRVGTIRVDGSYELESKYMYLENRLRKAMKC